MDGSIKVLGTGCIRCTALLDNAKRAMTNLGMENAVEMVANINDIIAYGVAVTPALVIDDMVWTSGEVPSVEELEDIFRKSGEIRSTR